MLVAATPWDYRYRFKGKFKTLRSLPFGHRIKLGFFLGLQNYNPQHGEPEFAKVGPKRFFLKITYHRPESSVCFGEILQFRQRSLGPPVFRNELGKAGMAHRKLGWTG